MVDPGLTVIQDSIGSATPENTGELIKFSHANNNNSKQQTLLFGSATWVLTARSLNRLERFQARCARGITHRHIRRRADGTWITPHTEEVLATCHLQPLGICIQRRRHTLFKHYAETSPLYRQCLTLRGTSLCSLAWWNLNLD